MPESEVLQAPSHGEGVDNNVIVFDPDSKSSEKKSKRGRPKRVVIPTPAAERLEFYAEQTKHIPDDPRTGEAPLDGRRGWLASKDFARQQAFRDTRLTPIAKALFSLLLDCVNRKEGCEYLHGYGGLAHKLNCHIKSAQKAMKLLVTTGYVVTKEHKNEELGWHHVSRKTLPTLVRASFVSAEDSDPKFPADTPPPNDGDLSAERRRSLHQTAELTFGTTSPSPPNRPVCSAQPPASQGRVQSDPDLFEHPRASMVEIIEPEAVEEGKGFGSTSSRKRKPRTATSTAGDGEAPNKIKNKRPWSWVHETERAQLWEHCQAFAAKRGWDPEFLKERLIAFNNHQKSRQIVSADWQAELENWLASPHHQPRTLRRFSRPSVSDLADEVFSYTD